MVKVKLIVVMLYMVVVDRDDDSNGDDDIDCEGGKSKIDWVKIQLVMVVIGTMAGFNDDSCVDNNDYGGNADSGDEGNNDDK